MKKILIVALMVLFTVSSLAQYREISVNKKPKALDIVQIDYLENSTIVFFKYVCQDGVKWSNIGDKTFVKLKGDFKQYHLINSINLPINSDAENRYMYFDNVGQIHYFAFEFEKLPKGMEFDIVEDENNPDAYNFSEINVDTLSKGDYMNINDYISSTPVKELGRYINNGVTITYVKYNGIIITT